MAKPTKARQLYDELLARYGQRIAEAFQTAVDDLRANIDLQRVIAAVQAADLNGALDAMHLDAAAFSQLQNVIGAAYAAGGQATTSTLPPLKDAAGHAVIIRFNGRNTRAEAWLKDHSSTLVTRIVDDQRTAIRNALTDGMAKGQNPRTVALNIVGRIDRATGKRSAGIIGLTAQQEQFTRSAAVELASGDPALLKNYLSRSARDKRFDRTVQKAIDTKTPVPASVAGKAVTSYQNRLLKQRGDMLGANEAFSALGAAKHEAFTQVADSGAVPASSITKRWRHFDNEHPRNQHIAMNGKQVGLDGHFILPDGTQMLYPHDPSAPASQVVGCHCQADYKIDFYADLV